MNHFESILKRIIMFVGISVFVYELLNFGGGEYGRGYIPYVLLALGFFLLLTFLEYLEIKMKNK